ncbi:UNVERIFIED_CONTAM: hypothetical protein GTU68_022384 [Idotea baltica]|nr:hypothetical protein [Idotea baltica]
MIISFTHKGLKKFYQTGSKAGIQAQHAVRLSLILSLLDVAEKPDDLDVAGLFLHQLKGSRESIWSVRVNGNWRITFRFIDKNIELVNYEDYH